MTKNSVPSEVTITSTPYNQPPNYGDMTLTTSQSLLDELVRTPRSGSFSPYSFYNKQTDSVEAHFKNSEYYRQPLNENVELFLSHDNDEIVGVNILNMKQIIPYQF